jgi:hypothetical protein
VGSKLATACAILSLLVLFLEHFIDHGRNLNGIDHWLSEYVLSESAPARWLMWAAFMLLAGSALGVSLASSRLWPRLLFGLSALGLGVMAFFESDPNDGLHTSMSWPPTAGNVHQILLYLAIGGALLGMLSSATGRRAGSRLEWALVGAAICATLIQTWLVAISTQRHEMTRFGGITERIIVVAVLLWVLTSAASPNLGTIAETLRDQRIRSSGRCAPDDAASGLDPE